MTFDNKEHIFSLGFYVLSWGAIVEDDRKKWLWKLKDSNGTHRILPLKWLFEGKMLGWGSLTKSLKYKINK